MGCGISSGRDDSNYHGVAAPYGSMLNTSAISSNSSVSETSSDASEDFEEPEAQLPTEAAKVERKKKSGSKEKRKRKKRKNDQNQMLNFGEFRVKMVDELGKEEASHSQVHPTAAEQAEPARIAVIKRYNVGTCGGHASRVKMSLVTPMEKNMLSCSNEDATVSLWDLSQRVEVGRLVGHDDAVIGGCISADSRLIATTSRDATLIIWDISTQKIMLSLTHPKVVVCCCFSPDSQLIVSGCQDQVCRVWDLRTSKEILNFAEHRGIIMSIAFSPNAAFVASGASDRKVFLWNMNSPKSKLSFSSHNGAVVSLDINNNSSMVVSADEKSVIVWRSDDGEKVHEFDAQLITGGPSKRAFWNCVCFGPGNFNELVVIACSNRTLYFYHIEGREELSLYLRSSVCSLGRGTERFVVAGDTFGNNYVVSLS